MRKMEVEDLVMTDEEVAELPVSEVVEHNGRRYTIHYQEVARLLCECIDDDMISVMSQHKPGKWHEVIHDGKKAIYCECDFALHHDNWCPNHIARAQMVLDKYRKRLGLDNASQAKPVKVDSAQEVSKTPAIPEKTREDTHRADAPLARQTFNLWR